jgi:hypothetical protein
MSGTIRRGKVIRGDLALYDGRSNSYTRLDASGGTVTGLPVGTEVDVLQVYGAGTDTTRATIVAALSGIGTQSATLVFSPGTWTIDASLTIPSNFTCRVPARCIFSVSSGQTLTFSGPVLADSATFYSGSGSTALSVDSLVGGKPWIARTAAEVSAGVIPANPSYSADSPYYDIRRAGAIGDDSTDNSTALANAIAATAENATLFVPQGTFRFSSALNLGARSIIGCGFASVLKYTGSGVAITAATSSDGVLVRLEDFRLLGASAAGGLFWSGSAGAQVIGPIEICRVFFEGFSGVGAYCVRHHIGWSFLYRSCVFRGYYCAYMTEGATDSTNEIKFDKCKFEGSHEVGIKYAHGTHLEVTNCFFAGGANNSTSVAIEIAKSLNNATFPAADVKLLGNEYEGTYYRVISIGDGANASSPVRSVDIDGEQFEQSQTNGTLGDALIYLDRAAQLYIKVREWPGTGTAKRLKTTANTSSLVLIDSEYLASEMTINAATSLTLIAQDRINCQEVAASGSLLSGMSRISVHRDGSDQSINSGAATKVQWTTEALDSLGDFDNATNYRWIPSKSGYYNVRAHVTMLLLDDAKLVQLSIYKNGSRIKLSNAYTSKGNANISVEIHALIEMNGSSDYLEVYVEHDHGSARNLSGGTDSSWFEANPAV